MNYQTVDKRLLMIIAPGPDLAADEICASVRHSETKLVS